MIADEQSDLIFLIAQVTLPWQPTHFEMDWDVTALMGKLTAVIITLSKFGELRFCPVTLEFMRAECVQLVTIGTPVSLVTFARW